MSKKIFLTCWLLSPVALLAYHYGPGQVALARDEAAKFIAAAAQCEQREDWPGAATAYAEALGKLPAEEQRARWQLRLAQSKARMYSGELPEAIGDMEGLLAEMSKAGAAARQVAEVRAELASAEYYAGWLMRLEGAPTEEWSVEVDNARQHFRLLSEGNLSADPGAAKPYQENLEATIRLARMDLSDLRGMPLPKFCKGCKNVGEKCRGQRESQCKKPGEAKPKDNRGAGSGERPRGGS